MAGNDQFGMAAAIAQSSTAETDSKTYTDSQIAQVHSVPAGGSTNDVLTKNSDIDYDLKWAAASSGTGDVVGPASSTNSHVALFNGTTGKLLKDGGALATVATSGAYLDLSGTPTIPTAANPTGTGSDTVVNGSAATFMRSDASPAIQKASSSAFGLTKVDNATIQAVAGLISTKFCGFYVTMNSDFSVTDNTFTTVKYDTTVFDTLSGWNGTTGIYTPTKSGKWLIFWAMRGTVATTLSLVQGKLFKNSTAIQVVNAGNLSGAGFANLSTSILAVTLASMNGSTDTLRIDGIIQGSGGSDKFDATLPGTLNTFGGVYLGP
jgi:hypothetical protein